MDLHTLKLHRQQRDQLICCTSKRPMYRYGAASVTSLSETDRHPCYPRHSTSERCRWLCASAAITVLGLHTQLRYFEVCSAEEKRAAHLTDATTRKARSRLICMYYTGELGIDVRPGVLVQTTFKVKEGVLTVSSSCSASAYLLRKTCFLRHALGARGKHLVEKLDSLRP